MMAYFARPYVWQILLTMGVLILAAAATLAVPLALSRTISVAFGPGDGAAGDRIDRAFLGLAALVVALSVAAGARAFAINRVCERITADLRTAVYRHLLDQSLEFFETSKVGDVLSRLNADTVVIQNALQAGLTLVLRNGLMFVGGVWLLWWTSPRLASLMLVLLIVSVFPLILLGRRVRALSEETQRRHAHASGIAAELLGAVAAVQMMGREACEATRFEKAVDAGFHCAIRCSRRIALLVLLAILQFFGLVTLVLRLGGSAVGDGAMGPGELVQFSLYAATVAGAMMALSELVGESQRAAASAGRLAELLALRPAVAAPAVALPLPGATAGGVALEFDDVRFGYASRPESGAIAGVSFTVGRGETVAVVGPSGSGKTTLLKLILRFYDPQSGAIRLDGIDLRRLEVEALRRAVGIVSQESTIFTGSAMYNIRYGRPDASDDEVLAAARLAGADEFIVKLPQGFDCPLGQSGVRLSGGQRQRIFIARALLKNPALLLLDEATSALDAESERLVQRSLEAASRGRTTIVIAHRLATVQRADRILVVDAGRIVEAGTHASLVARGGLYAKLAAGQFIDAAPAEPDEPRSGSREAKRIF